MGFGVSASRLSGHGSGFRICGWSPAKRDNTTTVRARLGFSFRISDSDFGFRVSDFRFRVSDLRLQISDFGFRAEGVYLGVVDHGRGGAQHVSSISGFRISGMRLTVPGYTGRGVVPCGWG